MGEGFKHFLEFVWAVAVNWRTAIAAAVFFLFSFPNAALPEESRLKLDRVFPPPRRRQILAIVAIGYVVIAAFFAWDDERAQLEAALGKPSEVVKLNDRIAKLTEHRWEPLTSSERTALESKLSSMHPEGYIALMCRSSECIDLEDSVKLALDDAKWENQLTSGFGGLEIGVGVSSPNGDGRILADAIELSTNGRIHVVFEKRAKLGGDADKETQLLIGRKP